MKFSINPTSPLPTPTPPIKNFPKSTHNNATAPDTPHRFTRGATVVRASVTMQLYLRPIIIDKLLLNNRECGG